MKKPTQPQAQTKPLPPAQGKHFNASQYVRPGLSEAEVEEIKAAFDLFDSDQGGSIDTKGRFYVI